MYMTIVACWSDFVLGADTNSLTQQTILYDECIRDIVESAVRGFSGTAFCYGQTGAGKTFTMAGVPPLCMDGASPHTNLNGVIPHTADHIFQEIQKCASKTKSGQTVFLVRVSYIEIYNEQLYDLLNKEQQIRGGRTSENLRLRETRETGVYIQGLTHVTCKSEADVHKALRAGN